jgi:membrane associated rhomboid family serine protease
VLSAAFRPPATSIGASTAVFGALGIAAALAWQRGTSTGPGLRRWVPLAGGVMLLALLGVGGERTDIGAHMAGFIVGGVLGFLIHQLGGLVPRGRGAQFGYAAAAAGIFVVSWMIALG